MRAFNILTSRYFKVITFCNKPGLLDYIQIIYNDGQQLAQSLPCGKLIRSVFFAKIKKIQSFELIFPLKIKFYKCPSVSMNQVEACINNI